MSRKVVIIGATSGIGRRLAKKFASEGFITGATGRRATLLNSLREEAGDIHIATMDIASPGEAETHLAALIHQMGGMDTLILNAGVRYEGTDAEAENHTFDVNCKGTAALFRFALNYFQKHKIAGRIGVVTSLGGIRGGHQSPAYNASKAFLINYAEGYRKLLKKSDSPVSVTTVIPGYVETEMTKNAEGMFWEISAEKAAKLIFFAVENRKQVAYIPGRWRLFGFIYRNLPDWLLRRL